MVAPKEAEVAAPKGAAVATRTPGFNSGIRIGDFRFYFGIMFHFVLFWDRSCSIRFYFGILFHFEKSSLAVLGSTARSKPDGIKESTRCRAAPGHLSVRLCRRRGPQVLRRCGPQVLRRCGCRLAALRPAISPANISVMAH